MPVDDARRWDQRYLQDERFRTYSQPRPFLLEAARWLPGRGLALDVAMGLGGNAAFLVERGLNVVGVDISGVALRQAKKRLPHLMAVQADLDQFGMPPETFDVILNFYFLQRGLWHLYRHWLHPGGIIIIETLTQPTLEYQPDIDPQYLLQPNELLEAFSDMEVLVYREGESTTRSGRTRAVASMVARLG